MCFIYSMFDLFLFLCVQVMFKSIFSMSFTASEELFEGLSSGELGEVTAGALSGHGATLLARGEFAQRHLFGGAETFESLSL